MNVVLATDDNFVQHCCVAMTSVLINNSTDVNFYIFTEGLSEDNTNILKTQVARLGGNIDVINVDSRVVSKFPMPSNADAHISLATYYRLFSAILLPPKIEKAIYMDCDMVARKSFDELWKTNIDGYALGAVFQPVTNSQSDDKRRLMIPNEMGYFNAGILLMNLKYWRDNNVTDRFLDFISSHFDSIKQHDQDVLNAVLYNEVMPLDYTWNFIEPHIDISKLKFQSFLNYNKQVVDPTNIHFVSAPKPWDYGCRHPYKKEYYKYLSYTPFKGFRPSFNWEKFYKNCLRKWLLDFVCKVDYFNIRKYL